MRTRKEVETRLEVVSSWLEDLECDPNPSSGVRLIKNRLRAKKEILEWMLDKTDRPVVD
jgi:hypothetical protein